MSKYVYYQPNDKDLKDKHADCVIRALSKVFDCSWTEAYDMHSVVARKYQALDIFSLPIKERNEAVRELGLERQVMSRSRRRMTVKEFAVMNSKGRFIADVAHHVVAIVDGKYYDTWDCGWRPMYTYYEVKGGEA